MSDSYYLRLDLDRIRQRIPGDDGPTSIADAKAWLRANDFLPTGEADVWVAEEVSLELLREGEVLGSEGLA